MATDVEQREDAMEHVYRLLDRSRGPWRVMDMLGGLLKTVAVFGGALVIGFLADNLLHLPGWVRLLYGIGALAALIAMVARFVLHPLLRPMTDEMVAAHVERALPESANRLINEQIPKFWPDDLCVESVIVMDGEAAAEGYREE